MIRLVHTLLGWSKTISSRTVLGHPGSVDLREAAYIRDSNSRLNTLFQLSNRFKNTAHAAQLKAVYEKTKTIHAFLVARKRIQELELFHIQHTDHFISAFTAILEAHQKDIPAFRAAESANSSAWRRETEKKPLPNGQAAAGKTPDGWLAAGTQIPRLTAPLLRINPKARILYHLSEAGPEGSATREIGLSSPQEDQECFLAQVTARFGISGIAYLGNALVNIPDTTSSSPTGLVAIIRWQSSPYAVNFTDGRLFPVKLPA